MRTIHTDTHTPSTSARAQLVADAVISAYLNEISGAWRPAPEGPAPRRALAAAM